MMEKFTRAELMGMAADYRTQAKQFKEWADNTKDTCSGAARLWMIHAERATSIANRIQRILDNHSKRIEVTDH